MMLLNVINLLKWNNYDVGVVAGIIDKDYKRGITTFDEMSEMLEYLGTYIIGKAENV